MTKYDINKREDERLIYVYKTDYSGLEKETSYIGSNAERFCAFGNYIGSIDNEKIKRVITKTNPGNRFLVCVSILWSVRVPLNVEEGEGRPWKDRNEQINMWINKNYGGIKIKDNEQSENELETLNKELQNRKEDILRMYKNKYVGLEIFLLEYYRYHFKTYLPLNKESNKFGLK